MKIITGTRQTGKTTKMLQDVIKNHGVIITSSYSATRDYNGKIKDAKRKKSTAYAICIKDADAIKKAAERGIPMYIDDAEEALIALMSQFAGAYISRDDIKGLTVNVEYDDQLCAYHSTHNDDGSGAVFELSISGDTNVIE